MRNILFVLFFISGSGCSSKGYSGPSLDSSEVSNISFHANNFVDIKKINVDNNDLGIFSTAIDVLEGGHNFIIDYEMESMGTCYPEQRICQVTISTGQCKGTIKTLKARNYLVSLTNKSSLMSISVLPKGFYDFNVREDESNVGSATCTEHYTRSIIKSDRS